ncbi:MAG: type II toxin-antitoxin system RelE/ParE family toxin [Patescibacteria group bacterium]
MEHDWKIVYWSLPNRPSPIFTFIETLPLKAKTKLIQSFDLLIQYNIQLREPHVKKVAGTSLWELRILGQDNVRIFYVAVLEKKFLLLHGFVKKTQKTPQKEIRTALHRLTEH